MVMRARHLGNIRLRGLLFTLGMLVCLSCLETATAASYVTFESGQVRPLVISPDGNRLYAVNTPDNRLELFDIKANGLSHVGSIPVGMEPVAVAARSNNEIWVVNHLSDSVSIVDVSSNPARVVRTLLVGDEPRDIVFAGTGGSRAFITAAHRGQNSPYTNPSNPGDLMTAGIGRADVWVFDAANLGTSFAGNPLTIVTLFGDTPRALAVSPDGGVVYAAVFHSGNQTTTVQEQTVCNGGFLAAPCVPIAGELSAPGGLPAPNRNVENLLQPETGLIVKFNGVNWLDELNRPWDNMVRFNLPDLDVFAINANANPPALTASYAHVGTILFNMAVNPVDGKLYVANTEAFNQIRFEGERAPGNATSTVQGHLHETRLTIIDPSANTVTPRHLNKHINYSVSPAPAGVSDKSLALPRGVVISRNGQTLYLAAQGSAKVGIFNVAQLNNNSFVPDAVNHVNVSGGGPTGLALDEARRRLYVMTRFDNSISVIDTDTRVETKHYALHNPEPASVIQGRAFLYDARLSSSNGEAACGSCHVDGDLDSLAWDLGDPEGSLLNNPGPFLGFFAAVSNPPLFYKDYHPMKGPMTSQTLRGMAGHGPMHWRGDRTGGNDEATAPPNGGTFNEDRAFKTFNAAFRGLLGRSGPLTDAQMQAFTDFILSVTLPPNPIRALDNSLTPDQQAGRDFYFTAASDGPGTTCNTCHVLDPAQGFFGTDGSSSFEAESQHFKIPHLRNMYTKVGMFGMPAVPFFIQGNNEHKGAQIRGFGFLHDGSVDTMTRFLRAVGFTYPGATESARDTIRDQLSQFMFAFDSNLNPIVGQQLTLTRANAAVANARVDLLIARAVAGETDLVVKGLITGKPRGWVRQANGTFKSDKTSESSLSDTQLRALAQLSAQELTYTTVPPGSGIRMGIDRDEDGVLDADDNCSATANLNQLDADGDRVGEVCDNCMLVSNADQRDSNGDGFGNRCDTDLNNDGVSNFADLAAFKTVFSSNNADADFNGDGVVNFPDLATMRAGFGKAPGPSAIAPR